MKKSTLLSLLTAGAVIATSAGTFAAWDKLSDTTNAVTLNYANGINVTTVVQPTQISESLGGANGVQTVSSSFTIKLENTPTNSSLQLQAVDATNEAEITPPTGVTIDFVSVDESNAETPITNGKIDNIESGEKKFKVKVSIDPDNEALNAREVQAALPSLKVKATLTPPVSAN